MAWYSGITQALGSAWETAKDVYRDVDVVLGGILPGGYVKPKEELGAPVLRPEETAAAASFRRRTGREPTIVEPRAPGEPLMAQVPTGRAPTAPPTAPPTEPLEPTIAQQQIPPETVPGVMSQTQQQELRKQYEAAGIPIPTWLGTGLDYFYTAFSHPFKTIGAAVDPNVSVKSVVDDMFNQPKGVQVTDIVLAGAGYASVVLGVNSLLTALTVRGTATVAGNVVRGEVAKAAAGQAVKKVAGQAAVNTATTAVKVAGIWKFAQHYKKPLIIMGLVGTYLYGVMYQANPRGDAGMALSIAINEAESAGDIEGARIMKEYFDEINDRDLWDRIAQYIPIIGTLKTEKEKMTGLQLAIDTTLKNMERQEIERNLAAALEDKIRAGLASEQEVKQFIANNPYSQLSKELSSAASAARYQESALYTQTLIEQIKNQGAQYRAGLYGGAAQFQPPSSLRFGLLHTAGGYEATGAGVAGEGDTYTVTGEVNKDEISMYLFGIPYAQLTNEQKAVVDKW